MRTLALTSLLSCVLLLGQPVRLQAGCGCDKPPPAPAAVLPNAAFPGMPVTFFDDHLKVGQTWTVVFRNGSDVATVTTSVILKRALTDPSTPTYQPQLVITVPPFPVGPTRIEASAKKASFLVPAESCTVIGKPVVVAEQSGNYAVKNYVTGVGSDGTLYISLGGLNNVCAPMKFKAMLTNYPLRFADGAVAILNSQGFFIDAFTQQSADHFSIQPRGGSTSDRLDYFRHSFEQYCADHQPGGVKEVDPQDPNWHVDGTAHTDYSTLILAISGRLDDGTTLQAGAASFNLTLEASISDNNETWAQEKEEESLSK
ncbi:MAG: hypothetical protein HY268_23435 [Deltaproteobacteria bacterium]|nr:hypothetical protein [Deltaproteobacteria bacterium]